jgi:uncharacterized protein YjbI with pentapeptide repeats
VVSTAAAAFGTVLVLGSIAVGLYLWLPGRRDADHRRNLGAALIGGAIIALAIFLIQIVVDERRQRDEAKQNLRVTLGLAGSLTGIDLSGASLERMYLAGKNLSSAQLVGADLSRAYLTGTTLRDADLSRARLGCANLNLANARNASFVETGLAYATLIGLRGGNAKFLGADLRGADLTQARLADASFVGADLSQADLSGADLATADLTDATLTDVQYDARTRWPPGFRPPRPSSQDQVREEKCR